MYWNPLGPVDPPIVPVYGLVILAMAMLLLGNLHVGGGGGGECGEGERSKR